MGIEEEIQSIKKSIQNLSSVLLHLDESVSKVTVTVQSTTEQSTKQLKTMSQIVEQMPSFSEGAQTSIQNLPYTLNELEKSLGSIKDAFEAMTKETKDDLKFIKVSYVEDVVGSMRNLSQEISEMVATSSERNKTLYESSIQLFGAIDEKLNNIESRLDALIENQTDQLATIADLRDRVNAIIQVELASLRDRIAIYLETTVNELKTSVTERLAIQDGTLQRVTQTVEQLTQKVSALPELMKQEIDTAVETRIKKQLASMEKEMKKMTALIIRSRRASES